MFSNSMTKSIAAIIATMSVSTGAAAAAQGPDQTWCAGSKSAVKVENRAADGSVPSDVLAEVVACSSQSDLSGKEATVRVTSNGAIIATQKVTLSAEGSEVVVDHSKLPVGALVKTSFEVDGDSSVTRQGGDSYLVGSPVKGQETPVTPAPSAPAPAPALSSTPEAPAAPATTPAPAPVVETPRGGTNACTAAVKKVWWIQQNRPEAKKKFRLKGNTVTLLKKYSDPIGFRGIAPGCKKGQTISIVAVTADGVSKKTPVMIRNSKGEFTSHVGRGASSRTLMIKGGKGKTHRLKLKIAK